MMKRFLALLCVLAMMLAALVGCSSSDDAAEEGGTPEVIKIGSALAMTGNSAELGTRVYRGVQLAVDECNAAGGINGVMIELDYQDDQGDPKQAATLANLFASDPDILACIASYNSSCTLAGAPIYNNNELAHICVGSSSPSISEAGEWTYRVYNSDAYRAAFDFQMILDGGYQTIGILYQNDDFGTGALAIAEEMMAEKGMEAAVAEGFLLGETKDFSTVITKMKDANCDAVFLIADETELAAFCTQAQQLGLDAFKVATGTFNPAVITLGGEAVEGLVGDSYWDPQNPPESVNEYVEKFKEAFDDDCTGDYCSPLAYDATNLIIQVLKDGATTRAEVKEGLDKYMETPFSGVVCNDITFDENGDVEIPMTPITIQNGEFVIYEG